MNVSTAPSGGLFGAPSAFGGGLGTQLFGSTESDTPKVDPGPEADDDDEAPPPPESESESEDSDVESSSSVKSIIAAPARTPSSSSPSTLPSSSPHWAPWRCWGGRVPVISVRDASVRIRSSGRSRVGSSRSGGGPRWSPSTSLRAAFRCRPPLPRGLLECDNPTEPGGAAPSWISTTGECPQCGRMLSLPW